MAGELEFTTAPKPRPDMAPQRGPGNMPFANPEEGTFIPKIPGSGPASSTRRTRGLLDMKTDLKSLKYSQFNVSPAVVKDINNPPKYNSFSNQVSRRADDLVRITKFVASANGLKFVAKQGLLSQINQVQPGQTRKEKLKAAVKAGAISAATVLGSTLAQVPVSGTGVHFIRGFGGYSYLTPGIERDPAGGLLGAIQNFSNSKLGLGLGKGVNGAQNVLAGTPVILDYVGLKDQENWQPLASSEVLKRATDEGTVFNPTGTITDKDKGSPDLVNFLDNPNTETDKNRRPSAKKYTGRDSVNLRVRALMGEQGEKRNKTDVTDQLNDVYDAINKALVERGRREDLVDIIPFEIEVISPDSRSDKRYSPNNFIYFRAHLDSFSDDFSGNWNETKYVGRAEPMYTYDGFNRSVSFDFKIAAFSRSELLPLYQKLNFLASSTAPTYNSSGAFMRGTFSRLTVGDYLYQTPGFFSKIGISWEVGYPWEINLENDADLPKVPHILNVSCGFTPVHNFIPALNQPFLMKDSFYTHNKSTSVSG